MGDIANDICQTLDEKVGDKSFYSLRELVDCGVFGSLASARRAVNSGRLKFIRISKRRSVVFRKDLETFLKEHAIESREGDLP